MNIYINHLPIAQIAFFILIEQCDLASFVVAGDCDLSTVHALPLGVAWGGDVDQGFFGVFAVLTDRSVIELVMKLTIALMEYSYISTPLLLECSVRECNMSGMSERPTVYVHNALDGSHL